MIDRVIRRLAQRTNVRVVVGTRRSMAEGPDLPAATHPELLEALGVDDDQVLILQRDPKAMADYARAVLAARAPDLVRSPLVAHDQKGELIGEVIRNGRPDKGMPALPMTPEQIADIAAFLHARALEALESSGVPRDYPAEKLTTGKVEAGKAFFEGPGGCSGCHANPAELATAGRKYSSIEFESHMLYPEDKPITAVVI
jgi:cytochrome c oxidase cbb3-type subunit 3